MLNTCIIGRRKILANLAKDELSFIKQKPIYKLLVLNILFNADFEGLINLLKWFVFNDALTPN